MLIYAWTANKRNPNQDQYERRFDHKISHNTIVSVCSSTLIKNDPFVLVWNDPWDAQLISWQFCREEREIALRSNETLSILGLA
jgi:hypothetical protein